ncbi:hypothetical protein OEZ86_003225 [Tetradesmus obliquus]|nr:hypothetical protein OEZ86_003225 [Tetradesmus obliquus]
MNKSPVHLLDDAAADHDSLGVHSVAKGTAKYLMHPGTGTSAIAIYGRWGQGKSTFMRLLEQEMVVAAARNAILPNSPLLGQEPAAQHGQRRMLDCVKQLQQLKQQKQKVVVETYVDLLDQVYSQDKGIRAGAMAALKRIAQPKLVCTWFNPWQYMTQEQVWAGLVVETVQAIEAALPKPQRWMLAWRYNLCSRPGQVFLQLLLPVLVCMLVVFGLVVFGVTQLQFCLRCGPTAGMCITQQLARYIPPTGSLVSNSTAAAGSAGSSAQATACSPVLANWLSALVAVVGSFLVLLVTINRVEAVIKPLSATISDKLKYLSLPDHAHQAGYQHEAIRDLKLMQALLQQRTHACGCFAALLGLWVHAMCACLACACFCCCDCTWALQSMEQQHHRSRRKQWSNHLLPAYNTLMTSAGANSTKLVVFIDDLDRVQPSKIVEVLAAVNLVLTAAGITTVIGMDKSVILAALAAHYKSDTGVQDAADLYLEKIIQVGLMLADPGPENYYHYLQGLRLAEPAAAQQSQLTPKQQAYVARHTQRSQEKHADPIYSSIEDRAAHTLLYSTELQRLTPRAVKRFLNHHYLAKFLLPESELVQPAVLDPYISLLHDASGEMPDQLAAMMYVSRDGKDLPASILPTDLGSIKNEWRNWLALEETEEREHWDEITRTRLCDLDLLTIVQAVAAAASGELQQKIAELDLPPAQQHSAADAAHNGRQRDQQQRSSSSGSSGPGGGGTRDSSASGSSSSSGGKQQALSWMPAGSKAKAKATEQLTGMLKLLQNENPDLRACLCVESMQMQLFIRLRFHMEFASDQVIAGPKEPEQEEEKLAKLASAGASAVLDALGKAGWHWLTAAGVLCEFQVLAGLPDDQRAAVLAARAEGALGLADGEEDDLDKLMADDPDRFEDDEEGEEEAGAAGGAANSTQQ